MKEQRKIYREGEVDEEGLREIRKKARERKQRYRKANPEKERERKQRWKKANTEKVTEYQKRYLEREKA